jgi:hypothetical protein
VKPGKRQREILDILQDGEDSGDTWTSGELYNDAGFWSVSTVAASDGVRYSRRCQADPARRLHEQGYVMYKETRAGVGEWGADRVVFCLTDKGKQA